MKSFTKQYTIKASLDLVWSALTDSQVIERWLGEKVTMNENVGSEFSLWNHTIWGKNIEVVKKSKLVQDWYGGEWDEPSKVTFEISEKSGIVSLTLVHENLPDNEADSFDKGWDDFYIGPLKEYCEKG